MSTYTAVIIEPRCHKALGFVLKNILTNLPEEWNVLIFHGNKNKEYITTIINETLQAFKKRILPLLNLEVDNLTKNDYNKRLTSATFYEMIPTEIFLIFQTDSMILEENKSLLELFLNYDYVGAPWNINLVNSKSETENTKIFIGNGGFSLRRKSKMIETCVKHAHLTIPVHEDIFFAGQTAVFLNKPSAEAATFFSVESIFNKAPFGIHAPWNSLSSCELKKLLDIYPDIQILMDLQ